MSQGDRQPGSSEDLGSPEDLDPWGDDAGALRALLVDRLVAGGGVVDPLVEAAMRRVPRHLFLPHVPVEVAYQDQAIPTKVVGGACLSSCSQPAMIAIMLDQLGVEHGHRVLEIGAGTGYNAALLAVLAGPAGSVVSLDIDADLVQWARDNLARAGTDGVEVHCADGAEGWAAGAPYDRIVATVGVSDLAPAWVDQLAPGGRLVAPLSLRGVQQSVCLVPEDGHLASRSIVDCGFIPMRGWLQDSEARLALPGLPGVELVVPDPTGVDPSAVAAALAEPGEVVATGVAATTVEELRSLARWLAFSERAAARLVVRDPAGEGGGTAAGPAMGTAAGPATGAGPVPSLWGWPTSTHERTTRVLLGRNGQTGLATLTGLGRPRPGEGRLPVGVHGYGPSGEAVSRLVEVVRAWDRAGRPTAGQARITVHAPSATLPETVPAPAVVDTPHARIVVLPS